MKYYRYNNTLKEATNELIDLLNDAWHFSPELALKIIALKRLCILNTIFMAEELDFFDKTKEKDEVYKKYGKIVAEIDSIIDIYMKDYGIEGDYYSIAERL
ncbi:hypothetical protein AGMMS49573_10430 [Endomicrobiia bacterium]|nr:hypothetical protein AGMMS49573_10430 [Endomicrobiia bacterium]